MARILILGGGFGGITVATELRRRLGKASDIVLIDREERFTMGLRKLWAVVGLAEYEAGSRPLAALEGDGVRFRHGSVTAIDPAARRVETDAGPLEGDYLVVALGAEPRADRVPGLAEHTHNVWEPRGVPALRDALGAFDGGHIAVVIAGAPYKCPPAPYECAMLLDEHLRRRGLRERTRLGVTTLQPMLMPNAGASGSTWLGEQLAARGIEFRVGRKVQRFEQGRAVFPDGTLEADLFVAVPPHEVPAVVRDSGLTGDGAWIQVDAHTLATRHAGVFAIGDVTAIKLANGLPLPKAGGIAESQGRRVAAAIAAELRGESAPASFDGRGQCFLELGEHVAALIEGEFYADPEPRVSLAPPAAEHAAAKRRFEDERLARWFGAP